MLITYRRRCCCVNCKYRTYRMSRSISTPRCYCRSWSLPLDPPAPTETTCMKMRSQRKRHTERERPRGRERERFTYALCGRTFTSFRFGACSPFFTVYRCCSFVSRLSDRAHVPRLVRGAPCVSFSVCVCLFLCVVINFYIYYVSTTTTTTFSVHTHTYVDILCIHTYIHIYNLFSTIYARLF